MIQNYIENANFEDTGFAYTLSLISGKHKMVILYCLMEFETVRFNELKRYLKTISDKTLSTNLKELEADKLEVITLSVDYLRPRHRADPAQSSAISHAPKAHIPPSAGSADTQCGRSACLLPAP